MKKGDIAKISKSFTEEDVLMFSKLSLDTNEIHLDENMRLIQYLNFSDILNKYQSYKEIQWLPVILLLP